MPSRNSAHNADYSRCRRKQVFWIPWRRWTNYVVQLSDRGHKGCLLAIGLVTGIPRVVIACTVSAGLLVVDESFDGAQGIGVEGGRGQLRVQLPGPAA